MEVPIDDHDAHAIRRVEAFSDVVFGFGLAETGLNLVIPAHAVQFLSEPIGLIAFTVTFAVISRLWWDHHLLMRHLFTMTRVTVSLDFMMLACTVLLGFTLQLWVHFGRSTLREETIASLIYCGVFAATTMALGLLFLLCTAERWSQVRPEHRVLGIRKAVTLIARAIGIAAGVVAAAVALPMHPDTPVSGFTLTIDGAVGIGGVAGVVAGQLLRVPLERIAARS